MALFVIMDIAMGLYDILSSFRFFVDAISFISLAYRSVQTMHYSRFARYDKKAQIWHLKKLKRFKRLSPVSYKPKKA